MMKFEDHFSKFADKYARYRPEHPSELFGYLAGLVQEHRLAWDCGTGNGQAARKLADYFERVYATDASSDQISHAFRHEKIEYHVEPAEEVSLSDRTVDLVTVAVAVHWFDFDTFYREVRRVLKKGGILAVWMYHLPEIKGEVEKLIHYYYSEVLAGYWPERFRFVEECYATLPFPFEELSPPSFVTPTEWNLDQLSGFLGSWSATGKLLEDKGPAMLRQFYQKLSDAWGDADTVRKIEWPIYMRVGKT